MTQQHARTATINREAPPRRRRRRQFIATVRRTRRRRVRETRGEKRRRSTPRFRRIYVMRAACSRTDAKHAARYSPGGVRLCDTNPRGGETEVYDDWRNVILSEHMNSGNTSRRRRAVSGDGRNEFFFICSSRTHETRGRVKKCLPGIEVVFFFFVLHGVSLK